MTVAKKYEINIKTFFDNGVSKLIKGLDTSIKRAKAFGHAMRSGMHSAPIRLLRNALAGLVGTLAAGVMQAAKFNIELARASTMTNQGIGWFRKMRKEIRDMSAELGVAKDQLSGGLYQALSAGVPDNNVLSFLSTAAKIAVADGSDVSTAVDGMSTVLNAFKIDASETERVADQLFNTVANGKTTFAELAHNLATVAPIAAANGIALNEVLAAVSTLTKQGTPTAQAMTQIRSAIVGANKALGDGWAKSMSLQDAFKEIEAAAGGSQTKLQKMLGTIEGVQGVLGITGINAEMAADDLASTADAAGRVDAAFQKVDRWRHWPKLWQSINGLVERTAQEADSRLAPAVLRIVEQIAELQDDDDLWNGLTEALDTAEEKITGILEFIRSGGDDAGQEVLTAVGDYLRGAAMNAGEGAMQLIAKAVPAIGRALGNAAKDALFGDDSARQAQTAARAQADEEFGIKRFSSMGYTYEDPTLKTPEYRQRVKELERVNLEAILKEQGISLAGTVGDGAGALVQADALSRLNKSANTGNTIKQAGERRARQDARWDERRNEAREAYEQKKKDLFDQAGRGYGRLQDRIRHEKNDVANAALYGTKGDLDAAQSKLQADQQLAAQLKMLANNIKNGSGVLQAASMELLQSIIDQQTQQQQQIEQLQNQQRHGRRK